MKKTTLVLGLAALAIIAFPTLRADDWEARAVVDPGTLIRNVSIPSPFRGLDGKTQSPGAYDLDVKKGTQGILIALLRNGKKLAEFPGKFVPGSAKAGMADGSVRPSGGSTQGHDISVRKAGGMQDIHFDASSKVSFGGGGGGAGKISCSLNFHPGSANLGSIEFLLPAVQAPGK